MAFSVSALSAHLVTRPLLGRFQASNVLIHVYEEDPDLLPSMEGTHEGEEILPASKERMALLTVFYLDAQPGLYPPILLAYYQGWASLVGPGLSLYTSALLDLQLMLRSVNGADAVLGFDDYTVEGLLFLGSRMGKMLAEKVKELELRDGGGGELFYQVF
jgi:hypothetical protein